MTGVPSRSRGYDQRSTGEASGPPMWTDDASTDERSIVAFNGGHGTDGNGLGPRLVWKSERLIRDWMTWTQSFSAKLAGGCPIDATDEPAPWIDLHQQPAQSDPRRTPVANLRLVEPIVPRPAPPATHIMPMIEGTFDEWRESTPDGNDPEAPRFLRMVSPQPWWHSGHEGRVRLSASAGLVERVPIGEHATSGPALQPIGLTPLPATLANISEDAADELVAGA